MSLNRTYKLKVPVFTGTFCMNKGEKSILIKRSMEMIIVILENKSSYLAAIWFSRLTETYVKTSNKQVYIKFVMQ